MDKAVIRIIWIVMNIHNKIISQKLTHLKLILFSRFQKITLII